LYGSSRGRRLVAAALVILVLLIAVNRNARVRQALGPLERLVSDVISPVQRLVRRIALPLSQIPGEIRRLRILADENLMLRERALPGPQLEADLEEARKENARLRELLRFTQAVPNTYIPAEVIGRNPDSWFNTAVINKGTADGVLRDDPVVTASGLVGRVTKVSANTASVMLLVDPDSGVGGLIQRTRDAGVVVGQAGPAQILKMKLFSRESDVKPGDVVVTSGLGSFFPKGLPVGKVLSVGRGDYGLVSTADVQPFANFDRLEEVLVLKSQARLPEGRDQ